MATETASETVVDHDIVHLCQRGFWWCKACSHLTNVVTEKDPMQPGEEYSMCVLCGSRKVKWHAPVLAVG